MTAARLDQSRSAPICSGPDPDTQRPNFVMPDGAVDCHAHVFGPPERYPYAAERLYTPPAVFLTDYHTMHAALGVDRGVLVQSAIHGTDNRVIVDAIAASNGKLRGVALIDERISDAEIARLARAGICGFRSNLVAKLGVQFDAARRLADRVARYGWHVQFLLDIENFPALDRTLDELPIDVVIDHIGRPDTSIGVDAPGFQALIRFLRNGRGWTKLSAPYRTSRAGFPYADITAFAHALIATVPDRLVWGTDWPHVMLEPPMPNTGALTDLLATWAPDALMRKRILVDNPGRLYGFRT